VSNPGDPYNSQSLVRYLETLDTSRILPLHGTYHIPGLEKKRSREKKNTLLFFVLLLDFMVLSLGSSSRFVYKNVP